MGRYELNDADNKVFFVSKQNIKKSKNLKVFHKHSHFEVLLARDNENSRSQFIIENGRYSFTSKSIVLSRPNLKHRTERDAKNTTRYLVCFRRSYIEPIAQFMGIDIDSLFSKYVLDYTDQKIAEIISVINKMIKVFKNDTKYEENKELRLLLAEFLYKISRYESEGEISLNEENVLGEVCNYLKCNYKQNITLEQLSHRFGINKYELCRKMKRKYGCTVNEMLTNVRINKAKDLLENTAISIVDISELVGYSSASYFSNKFKAYSGIAPVEYREIFKK